ncbi:hypothetical protein SEPCBS57363_002720 [Sporothrix epigloea]|uniref:GRF-type domain-containing protein n=1 Tax=Sporothrix epigloea TaxID=1892477 RepID=A0ABP0DJ78_9PEZI
MPRSRRRRDGRQSQPSTPRTTRTIGQPLTPSLGRGSDGLFSDGQWFCDCKPRRPAALRETRKPGLNKGRWFYTCPQERGQQCTFFLWENYAGLYGELAASGRPGVLSSLTRPSRPAYRTSIGRRTTPPADRSDGPAHITLATQQSLPAPPPASTGRNKQRVFTTPTAAKSSMADIIVVEDDESDDESDGFEPPPTPTPASRTRKNVNGAKPKAIAKSPIKLATARTPTAAGQPRNRITDYFGIAKGHSSPGKNSSEGDGKEAKIADPQTPRKAKSTVPRMPGHESIDYSDSEFDSEMERALVALADHSERKARRHIEMGSAGAGTLNNKAVDDGGSMAMLVDGADEPRRDIIVPVSVKDEYGVGKDSARRAADRQMVTDSSEVAMAADTAAGSPKAETGTIPPFAFLPKIPSANQLDTSFVSSVSSSQPTTQTASSQGLTQDSQSTIATTTPPSSFRSDAGMQFKSYFENKYGDNSEDSEDDDDSDSFTSMSHKRASSWEEDEEEESSAPTFMRGWTMGSMTYPVPAGMARGPTAEGKFYWPADERMYVEEEEEEDEDQDQETPVPPPQPSHASHLTQSSQPEDHNVTLEVLQLLAGQPVEPRVLQQIRLLLNGAFDEMYEY